MNRKMRNKYHMPYGVFAIGCGGISRSRGFRHSVCPHHLLRHLPYPSTATNRGGSTITLRIYSY